MKKLLLLLSLIASISAHAELLIEPLVGWNTGGHFDFSQGKTYSNRGGAAGGRLGFQKLGFQLGIDYLHSSFDMGSDDFETNVSMDEFGGFIGLELPILLRVYGGYIFSASGKARYNDGVQGMQDTDFLKGSGGKVGLGFTGLPFLVINFEYRIGKFSEYEINDVKQTGDVEYNSYLVSVSLPITL